MDRRKSYNLTMNKSSLRARVLKTLHNRKMLILVCSLVILECLCVMTELMVDLHGIRVIFNQEEHALQQLIDTMRRENGNCTEVPRLNTFSDIMNLVKNVQRTQTENRSSLCHRSTAFMEKTVQTERKRQQRSILDVLDIHHVQIQQNRRQMTSADRHPLDKRNILAKDIETDMSSTPKVFILSIQTEKDNYFLISTFEEIAYSSATELPKNTNFDYKKTEYDKIQTISHTIKYIGFCILSAMVIETLLKIVCLGLDFFRKKIEVFDAFIVLISFTLDVIFIDSKWYETGKDVTTVLVLLLPWRIVRIINSFVMTISHKHHIQMMSLRQSKKKIFVKLKKLRHLMIEMRRDIDLLITLSKSKGATDPEIFNCIYGKGRGTKSLSAITSFASLMFISTLGKDLGETNEREDDMYGQLIRDILEEDGEDDNEDTENDKTMSATSHEKDIYVEMPCGDTEDISVIMENAKANNKSLRRETSHSKVTRRVTLPRRLRSFNDDIDPVYFINDAYDVGDDETERSGQKSLCKSKRTVQSLPHIYSSVQGKNFVTFEVTTQVTYL